LHPAGHQQQGCILPDINGKMTSCRHETEFIPGTMTTIVKILRSGFQAWLNLGLIRVTT